MSLMRKNNFPFLSYLNDKVEIDSCYVQNMRCKVRPGREHKFQNFAGQKKTARSRTYVLLKTTLRTTQGWDLGEESEVPTLGAKFKRVPKSVIR